jgi:hypothetical protein
VFYKVDLYGVNFRGADLDFTVFMNCNLDRANLNDASASRCFWTKTSLERARFVNSKLRWAHIYDCVLDRANLHASDLLGSVFEDCAIRNARFTAASGTFINCNFEGTTFDETHWGRTDFVRCSLGSAALSAAWHARGYVHMDIETLRITAKYFRQCSLSPVALTEWMEEAGIREELVRLFRGWVASAVGYHDVFISYSNSDKGIVSRVVDSLISRGVHCWIDRDQLYAGDELDTEIIEAINASGRMLAFLSQDSIRTGCYARREVEHGIERERKTDGSFQVVPVILDKAVLDRRSEDEAIALLCKRVGMVFSSDKTATEIDDCIVALQNALERSGEDRSDIAAEMTTRVLADAAARLSKRLEPLLTHVKWHGPADIPPDLRLHGIAISSYGGETPVQADGTIDGFSFYFRAREGEWTFSIGDPFGAPIDSFSGETPAEDEHAREMSDHAVAEAMAHGIVQFRQAYVRKFGTEE